MIYLKYLRFTPIFISNLFLYALNMIRIDTLDSKEAV